MKNFIAAFLLFFATLFATKAQTFLNKIPITASAVIKYSGNNFTQTMPISKLDSYSFVKDNFYKMLGIDTLTSLQNVGIDFAQDSYQYISLEDSSLSFVTLLHIKNVQQFLQLIKANYKDPVKNKMLQKNGFNFLPTATDTYIGWDTATAIIVHTTYQNKKTYYDYYTQMALVDTVVIATPPTKPTIKLKEPKTPTKPLPSKTKPAPKKPEPKKPIINQNYEYHIQDSINELKRELWLQQQDIITNKKQQAQAEKIINILFNGNTNSIENELSYNKIIDTNAHISIWINTESISNQYWNYFSKGAYSILHQQVNYIKDTTNGYKTGINIYFDKEKLRMQQKTYAADSKIATMGKAVMNSKQNQAIIGYVNPGNLGYFSMSINTEAMENYYYTLLKKYFTNTPYMNEYADIVDAYIDLLEIIIDEKGIADLFTGNYLFVVHDMSPKTITYTDYDYDKEFNKTEVKRTKKELSPNFSFIIETHKENFMQKIAHLPLKYAQKNKYNYNDLGGYYQLVFDTGAYPITSLYFIVKDSKAIITTSKKVIDLTLSGKAFDTDEATKYSIANNNYSLNINTKKILQNIATQVSANSSKKMIDYLYNNLGDIKMESNLTDDMIQGITTFNITGTHNNSLEFFFNMMNEINTIIEKDK